MALIIKSDVIMTSNSLGNIKDSLTTTQIVSNLTTRVVNDGGVIVNNSYLESVVNYLVTNNLAGKVRNFASASLAVKKDVSDNLIKLYDLFGSDFIPNYYQNTSGTLVDKASTPVVDTRKVLYNSGDLNTRPYILTNASATGSYATSSGGVLKEQSSNYISANNTSIFVATALADESSRPEVAITGFFGSNINDKNPIHVLQVQPGTSTDGVVYRTFDARNDTTIADGQFSSLTQSKSISLDTNLSAIKGKKILSSYYAGENKQMYVFANQTASLNYANYTNSTRSVTSITEKSKVKVSFSVPYVNVGTSYVFPNIKIYDIVVMRDLTLDQHKQFLEFLNSIISL